MRPGDHRRNLGEALAPEHDRAIVATHPMMRFCPEIQSGPVSRTVLRVEARGFEAPGNRYTVHSGAQGAQNSGAFKPREAACRAYSAPARTLYGTDRARRGQAHAVEVAPRRGDGVPVRIRNTL